MVALIVTLAFAAEPEIEVDTEIVVWGDAVDAAREEVITELLDEGYTLMRRRGNGSTVYRHEDSPWKGRIILDDSGWMFVRREPLRVEGRSVLPGMARNSAGAWAMCVVWPFLCVRAGGAVISENKFHAAQTDLVVATGPLVTAWNDRIADRATTHTVEQVPELLEACWNLGQPISGEVLLADALSRRAAIGSWWYTRTDTPWGDQVRDAIEAFVRAVVQPSDEPFTAAEIAALNEGRDGLRQFLGQRGVGSLPVSGAVEP